MFQDAWKLVQVQKKRGENAPTAVHVVWVPRHSNTWHTSGRISLKYTSTNKTLLKPIAWTTHTHKINSVHVGHRNNARNMSPPQPPLPPAAIIFTPYAPRRIFASSSKVVSVSPKSTRCDEREWRGRSPEKTQLHPRNLASSYVHFWLAKLTWYRNFGWNGPQPWHQMK